VNRRYEGFMETILNYIVRKISSRNPVHSKKLKSNLANADDAYFSRADLFLKKYTDVLQCQNKTIDYAIDCYLQMLADVNYESVQFIQTGTYSSKSFAEVNKRVYENPEVMDYYMHGLLLSQFLWTHHYKILLFFERVIGEYSDSISNYLEVGGGHGLYISEAMKIVSDKARYSLVDISQRSVELSKMMIGDGKVSFFLTDVFDHHPDTEYDFITMGEVLEHVEDPVRLLKKIRSLLREDGRVFITAPTNAPAIDHIYLFRNADEIRSVVSSAGFRIMDELCVYSEDVTEEIAEKYKVSMMFAGILAK